MKYKTLNKILLSIGPLGTAPSLISLYSGQVDYINNAIIGGFYSFGGLIMDYSKNAIKKKKIYNIIKDYSKNSAKINGICGSIVGGINLGFALKENSPYSLIFWTELSAGSILITKSLIKKYNPPKIDNYTEIEKRFLEIIDS